MARGLQPVAAHADVVPQVLELLAQRVWVAWLSSTTRMRGVGGAWGGQVPGPAPGGARALPASGAA